MSNDQNKSNNTQNDSSIKAADQKEIGQNPTAPKIADPPAGDPDKSAPKTDVVGGAAVTEKKS